MVTWLDEVRGLLAARPARQLPPGEGLVLSAVLVPLYVAEGQLWVLLTRRNASLPHHAGQYSFPGGVREPGDADDVATALRESREELGIDSATVVVLGRLDDIRTPTGYQIAPVVGAIPYPLSLEPAEEEVEAVVPFPYAYLANPEMVEEQEFVVDGRRVTAPVFHYRGHRVWGATARMLADLVERLSGSDLQAVRSGG